MICKERFELRKDGKPRKSCFCRTPGLIENYEKAIKDTTQTWVCHHRLETHNSDGERRLVDISHSELKALGMYYDRPPEELIFLTIAEHGELHHKGKPSGNKGKHHSEETKRRMSEANKGKPSGNKGKPSPNRGKKFGPLSEDAKQRMSWANIGRHWFNNGIVDVFQFECPEGFVPGRLPLKRY